MELLSTMKCVGVSSDSTKNNGSIINMPKREVNASLSLALLQQDLRKMHYRKKTYRKGKCLTVYAIL